MQAPGVSIRDIFDAAVKCKQIYDKFNHPFRSVPKTLTAFKQELDRVQKSLEIQDKLESWTGQHYPGAEAFKHTIEECAAFLTSKRKAQTYDNGTKSISSKLQVTLTDFDTSMEKLRMLLSHRQQEFLDWKINLLLEYSLSRTEHLDASRPIGSSPGSIDRSSDSAGSLNNAVADLVRILYQHKRLANDVRPRNERFDGASTGSGNHESVDQLNASFCMTISRICKMIDLPDEYQPPQVTLQSLSHHISEFKQQAAIEASTHTVRYPPSPPSIFPRHFEVQISVWWQNRERSMKASSYVVDKDLCLFYNASRQPIFEHRISPKRGLDTYRHSSNRTLLTVRFAEDQVVTMLGPNGPRSDPFEASIEYVLSTSPDYEQFQSDIRGKRFLRDFFVNQIDSQISGPLGNANKVCLKLWRDNCAQRSISFPAFFDKNEESWRVWQIPLEWFETPKIKDKDKIVLKFMDPSTSSSRRRSGGSAEIAKARSFWVSKVKYLGLTFGSTTQSTEFVEALEEARKMQFQLPYTPLSESLESSLSRYTVTSDTTSTIGSPISQLSTSRDGSWRSASTAATSPMSPALSPNDIARSAKLSPVLPRPTLGSPQATSRMGTQAEQPVAESRLGALSLSASEGYGRRDVGTDPEPSSSTASAEYGGKSRLEDAAATPMTYLTQPPAR